MRITESLPGFCGRPSVAQVVWVLLFGASAGFTAWVVRVYSLSLSLRWVLAMIPVVCGIGYVAMVVRDMSRLDELQRRLYFEAAAVVSIGVFLLGLVYPTFERAGLVGPLDPLNVSIAVAALAMIGYARAWRRYR